MAKNLLKALCFSGALLLSGCIFDKKPVDTKNLKIEQLEKGPEMVDYIKEFPMYTESGMALTSGDFDGDGDLDFIAGAVHGYNSELGAYTGKLYFYEGDGKGNFKLRQYEKKK